MKNGAMYLGTAGHATMYSIIVDDLTERINKNDYAIGVPFCTEIELCEKYGVSRITAKRAIEILEQKGLIYRKRGVGSFVLTEKSDGEPFKIENIALVIPFGITKGGMFRAIDAATDCLAENKCFFSLYTGKREKEVLKGLYNSNVKAVLYYPFSEIPTNLLDPLVDSGKPVIILDKPHEYERYSSIVCDNKQGEYMLTRHLLSYGHQNIVYLSRFSEELASIRERYQGYKEALAEADNVCDPRFVKIDTNGDEPPDHNLLRHTINTLYNEGVTAILCENDEVAFHVYMTCKSLSLRMPEDISIAGFDNIEWSVMSGAHITTVDQGFTEIGGEIVKLLTKPSYSPIHITIPVKLVPRTTTGPCPKHITE